MRIALLTDSDAFAGTERHIHDLDVALRALGVDTCVCCPAGSPLAQRIIASRGRLTPIEKRGPIDVRAIRALARRLRRGEIDLIHAHNGRTALIAAAAKRLAGRGKVMLTQHFLAPAYVGRRGMKGTVSRVIHHWVDRQIDHVVAISDAVRDAVLGRGEMPPSKLTTIHNGIRSPESFAHRESVRREFGVGRSSLLLLAAARLAPEKRIDVLIEAMRQVVGAAPHVTCVVAGGGEQLQALQQQIDRADLTPHVRLLGFRDDVIDLMAACDVFVLPSDAEPFGLALVEAMALEKCVIATDAGGPKEIVEHGVSGLLAVPADAASLAQSILHVAHNPQVRQRLGQAAAVRFHHRFQCDRMARAVADLYGKTLGAGGPATTSEPRQAHEEERPSLAV
jgi:glycosyltransferase involved in cell wall biosynthesis